MSYRHSSYRKLKKAAARGDGRWTPADAGRVRHWAGLKPPPKGSLWGVPKKKCAPRL